MDQYDLRSDTVTWPTPEMREAMATAELGDDVFYEDPTLNALQDEAAALLGKEAGLFVTSGTQGNLSAALAHCGRGDEAILGKTAHMFRAEAGSLSGMGGVHSSQLSDQPDGQLPLDAIRAAIRVDDEHYPRTRLICLETPHADCDGTPLPLEYVQQVAAIAKEHGVALHIDGARLFNAAAALGVPAAELVAPADSASFCLSKGLCAPIGSVVVGDAAFIERVRRIRKMLGGGLRQAGVPAAAGRVSLQRMIGRIGEDHRRARMLAEGLAQIPHIRLNLERVQTNMFYLHLLPSAGINPLQLTQRLAEDDVLIMASRDHRERIRLVTHYWITDEAVEHILAAFRRALNHHS
ncbi:MAG: low-specificity L-threonine aldolase [Chloroflexi bacterium]|nr:low-specificity L-threonine aldolase [Chloroflexota bacterium]